MRRFVSRPVCKWSRACMRGATAVEFALISPVLFMLMLGIIEVSMIFIAQNALEHATYVASRLGKTGYAANNMTREETIRAALDEQAGLIMDSGLLTIDTQSYPNFGDVGSPEPFVDANGNGLRDDGENYTDVNGNGQYDTDMGSVGAGEAGEVVVYTASYPWTLFDPMVGAHFGTSGVITLTARAVVQNEPF